MTIEKRQYPRVDETFVVKYHIDDNAFIEFPSRNISASGLSFITDRLYAPGQPMKLTISLENIPGHIQLTGQIVRVWRENDQNLAGFHITDIESADKEVIVHFIMNAMQTD